MNLPISELRQIPTEGFRPASKDQVSRLTAAVASRMGFRALTPTDLFTHLMTQGTPFDYETTNARQGFTSLVNVLTEVGFNDSRSVCVGWVTGDEIDVVDRENLKGIFDKVWRPLLDDIVIFDPDADWCVSINENGGVRSLKQNIESTLLSFYGQHEEFAPKVKVGDMEVQNLSGLPLNQILDWLPKNLHAEQVVFFPDACPSAAPLPTGVTVATRDPNWRQWALSDVGCGMQLLKSSLFFNEFLDMKEQWAQLGRTLGSRHNEFGDLGGGNHFVDAIADYETQRISFLIHTGSRLESGLLDDLVDSPEAFDKKYKELVDWAKKNRRQIARDIGKIFGKMSTTLDLAHNTVEQHEDGLVIIRKGTVALHPGDLNIIPSSLMDDIALVRATQNVQTVLNSSSHGTGRAMSRSEAKQTEVDIHSLRNTVMIPDYIDDKSFRTEGPESYRPLGEALENLGPSIEQVTRFMVVGYLGHLPRSHSEK